MSLPSKSARVTVGLLAATLLLIYSCGTPDRRSDQGNDEQRVALSGGMTAVGDSVELPSFQIEVKLSDRASKKLARDHETIIVDAFFEGIPTDTTRKEYQEEGRIPVGSHKVELVRPGTAVFSGVRIGRADYDALADKNFEVLINIYSGRKSSELNILNCDILQEPISSVRGKKHTLKGDLID